MKFTYYNPVKIHFGVDWLSAISDLAQRCKNERFLLVTSKSFSKRGLSEQIANAFGKQLVGIVDEILPNPQLKHLSDIASRLKDFDCIVALGGGSVIDSAKFLSVSGNLPLLKKAGLLGNPSSLSTSGVRGWENIENTNNSRDSTKSTSNSRGSIFDEKSGLRSHEQGNKTESLLTKRVASLPDLSQKDKRAFFIFSLKTPLYYSPRLQLVAPCSLYMPTQYVALG